MTVEQLAVLPDHLRTVVELSLQGVVARDIGARLGLRTSVVMTRLKKARKLLGCQIRGAGRPRGAPPDEFDYVADLAEADARNATEVAMGRRCGRCHLRLPCGGHDYEEARRRREI